MKVAVFHNLPSGGAKRALYNLAKHLMKLGHVVDAFVPEGADEKFFSMKEVVRGYRAFPIEPASSGAASGVLRRIGQFGNPSRDLERTHKRIAEAINAGSYDVVLSEQDIDTLSPFILRFLTGPVVYYCQQPDRSQEAILAEVSRPIAKEGKLGGWRERWNRHLLRQDAQLDKDNARFASYVVTNSYFSREVILRAYGLNAFVSYLGTDIDVFRPLDGRKEDYVLSVGSCGPEKGFDFLVRSVGRMDPKLRPKILIVSNFSNPQWEAYLVGLAATLNVDLCIKKGVSDSELVCLYNKAKLFVYASYLEPFGLVILEAMACGTPIIAVKEGGVRESVVHNETGMLIDRDEEAFAQAIGALLQDGLQRERLARRALEAVRSFWTWQHAAKRLEGHLVRCASLRRT
jgi:glycosyltransferase involved in cell wall biosynthesis